MDYWQRMTKSFGDYAYILSMDDTCSYLYIEDFSFGRSIVLTSIGCRSRIFYLGDALLSLVLFEYLNKFMSGLCSCLSWITKIQLYLQMRLRRLHDLYPTHKTSLS